MNKIELLAPAGNKEALQAAVEAGADAVYLGLTSFSARAFAGNFTEEEFLEAVSYCHIRGVKVYVTINTMLYEQEIENAKKTVDFLYTHDVDALLIQDLGLFHWVRQCYPDLDVHCSTQMHIHNLNGVKFMQEQGAKRVVLARETPIELVREAVKTGMEIEVFVYGAICISYSGQCLMSASLKNRSANRGMCAQCCRLRYFREDGKPYPEGKFLLSPKDLNVIEKIPQLIEAGVNSLKIEGRMKRPEYVWMITHTFREAIDAYYAKKDGSLSEQRKKELLLMFNRGFSKGHLFHDSCKERMSYYRPNHQGICIGKVLSFSDGDVTVKLSDMLHQHDGLRILNEPYDTGLTAVKILKKGKLVSEAYAGDIVTLQCHSKPAPKKGQLLQKTSDAVLIRSIQEKLQKEKKKIPVSLHFYAQAGEAFRVELRDPSGNKVSASSLQPVQTAKNAPLSLRDMQRLLNKTNEYPFEITEICGEAENIFLPVKILNETRRSAFEKLMELRAHRHLRQGKKEYTFTLERKQASLPRLIIEDSRSEDVHAYGTVLDKTEVIHRDQNGQEELTGIIVSQTGDLYCHLHNCIAGMTFNVANSYALAFLYSIKGIGGIFFSSECSNEQIHSSLQAFRERYGFEIPTYKYVYGQRTVMYIQDTFMEPTPSCIVDEQGLKYPICRKETITEIFDPILYKDTNTYCYGSYIIENVEDEDRVQEEKRVYEEIYGRI